MRRLTGCRHPIGRLMLCGLGLLLSAGLPGRCLAQAPTAGALGPPSFASGYSSPAMQPLAAPTSQGYDHGDLTVWEQLMLELVNRARADPAAEAARFGIDLNEGLTPGTLTPDPKPPLAAHPHLIDAARAHSQWMLDNDVFDHTGVDGSSAGERMTAAGYVFSGAWAWGENLAWQGTTGSVDDETFTRAMHEGLFRSAGHRKNTLNGGFEELGVGVLAGTFFTDGRDWNSLIATHNFARSEATPGPLLLGVVYRDADGDRVYDPGEGQGGVTVTPDEGGWTTATAGAGGYAVPFAGSGTSAVTFAGGPLHWPIRRTFSRGAVNVKLDLPLCEDWDQDCDGLGDTWEMARFGSLEADGSGDFNDDGVPDAEAWRADSTLTLAPGAGLTLIAPPFATGLTCKGLLASLSPADPAASLGRPTAAAGFCNVSQPADFPLVAGEGYGLRTGGARTVTLAGIPGCTAPALVAGVNLRGHPLPPPGLGCHAWLRAQGPARLTAISRLHPVTARLETCAFSPGGDAPVGPDFPIDRGSGYRLTAPGPGALILPGCP